VSDIYLIDKRSGIYAIKHKDSGKIYIGSAVNLSRRKREHFRKLRSGIHPNPKLQNSWSKYGEDSFEFVILKYCVREMLIETEQKFIDEFNPVETGFNILKIAGSTIGYKHTDETKERLSRANTGYKHTEEAKELMRGRIVGEHTRHALSQAHAGKEMPREQRLAIGNAHRGRKRTPEECAAISRGKTGTTRPPITDETRARMRAAQSARRAMEKANV